VGNSVRMLTIASGECVCVFGGRRVNLSGSSIQPHPQGLLLVQNGRLEKPLAKAAEILQESWSILSCDT